MIITVGLHIIYHYNDNYSRLIYDIKLYNDNYSRPTYNITLQ